MKLIRGGAIRTPTAKSINWQALRSNAIPITPSPSLAYTLFEFIGEKWKADDNRWGIVGTPSQEVVGGIAKRWVPGPAAPAGRSKSVNPVPHTLLARSDIAQHEWRVASLTAQLSKGSQRSALRGQLRVAQRQLNFAQQRAEEARAAMRATENPNSIGQPP